MTKLELERRVYARLTETSSALWPDDWARQDVASDVANEYPTVRQSGKWAVHDYQQMVSDPGKPADQRTIFVVERAGDDVYPSESKPEADAVAEALNFVEAAAK